ncbi:MAG: hypothetical protein A3I77_01425 [Gammaproteobacteria bacterium RIFCSPLOWO2_02_FULL_42_14]|nr:MAG: hypothetical protein A3B71_07610 [Gammaproteobacteria bacterium RIFCSPHIGHO2_02_FULL_42_43]OGT29214.1 MAG: hypothetical protein A2624_07185 [Gammaproteobacteria bacterium RIFCSPHIGHO2_01_FULL_42_8]OGT52287.1 MAG: hypothetical protein A3E54_01485 [Gammaproteobacteria bacterium RIFCSPHIGHO2_12_FULL_41_25]OGT61900.1 MAG: hypothetical protein A3I77_01425 [Gammaproteobacteria bacterium RIFCSPLOWO2_02_FULL_42_14]OGT86390.1 MAG: hypothetical protein A3G86_07670 [Gammaproteobacteria bacterium R
MPTILRTHGFRFFFFSNENNEPPHIHVEHGDFVAKFRLNPVELADAYGFRSNMLAKITMMVMQHRVLFLEKWHEFFSNKI